MSRDTTMFEELKRALNDFATSIVDQIESREHEDIDDQHRAVIDAIDDREEAIEAIIRVIANVDRTSASTDATGA